MTAIRYATVTHIRSQAEPPAYGRTISGYGAKIPTRHMVRVLDVAQPNRWRRVYAVAYGNSPSLYITVEGQDLFLDATALNLLEASNA